MTKKKEEKTDYKKIAEELAAENAQLNEALLRERADAMNVRKRAEDERAKLAGFYKALVVKEILPVIDNFERALAAAQQNKEQRARSHDELQKGVESIHKQFVQVLEKIGVTRIKTIGEHFDPNFMEAVTMEEGDGEHEIVSEELQSGYRLGDELIRPAMVRVKG